MDGTDQNKIFRIKLIKKHHRINIERAKNRAPPHMIIPNALVDTPRVIEALMYRLDDYYSSIC